MVSDFEASDISETIPNNFDELAVVLPLVVLVDPNQLQNVLVFF